LIDTGADVSLEVVSAYDRRHATPGPPLVAANGTQIATFGERLKTIRLGAKSFTWRFVVADVAFSIIGADFLAHHGLMVDLRHQHLVDVETFETIRADAGSRR
jgi:hypothetical protein